ncbi:MAG TPA: sulfate ABC transporter permease subunit CysT [Blastocatellia bacterium]|nr:sulfate ABC transporter permease subunit CysT [Blastocatellia bacterium]
MKSATTTINAAPPRVLPWGRWGLRATAALYLGVMIALPLAAIIANGLHDGLRAFWNDLSSPAAFAALKLTITMAIIVTLINAVMGTLTAYVIVRYRFYGRGLLNGLIDMPFAIPTLVTGVMLAALYGPQRTLGAWLKAHGIEVIFATPGIVLALLVITYPFIIRAVQPVLIEAERSEEEAAYTIGASKWTTFLRVVFPTIAPAVVSGSLLCFARALGEFGSIVVVAGNIPGRTLTAPVYVYGQIESHNERAASAMSLVLLALSFALIVGVEWLQSRKRRGNVASDPE